MAKPKTRPISNSTIEKAIDALASAGVDIGANERAVDVQVPDERTVAFEPDVDINELPDGGADVNFDPNAPIDTSQIPFGDNLAEYIDEEELGSTFGTNADSFSEAPESAQHYA